MINLFKLGVTSGVYVNKVQDNSPAKAGGMQNGDVIVEVDDQEVSNLAYLRYLLYNHDIGDSMKVTVYRNGDYKDLEIHLLHYLETHWQLCGFLSSI